MAAQLIAGTLPATPLQTFRTTPHAPSHPQTCCLVSRGNNLCMYAQGHACVQGPCLSEVQGGAGKLCLPLLLAIPQQATQKMQWPVQCPAAVTNSYQTSIINYLSVVFASWWVAVSPVPGHRHHHPHCPPRQMPLQAVLAQQWGACGLLLPDARSRVWPPCLELLMKRQCMLCCCPFASCCLLQVGLICVLQLLL